MLKTNAITGEFAPVMDLREEDYYRVGPVGRSDYWRDRSARDEKSQSIVVARISNENASEGPFHSSASIFEDSGISVRAGSIAHVASPPLHYLVLDSLMWGNLNPLPLALTFSA